jgi:rhamnulokinase
MREIIRMENGPQKLAGRLVWPLERLYAQVVEALGTVGGQDEQYASIGVDAWGVDYLLLDENHRPLCPPVAYRDNRTRGMIARFVGERLTKAQIYAKTGIQFLPFNSLYQLYAQSLSEPELLARTRRILFISDYFHFLLSGRVAVEKTIASTSQIWNLQDDCWDPDLIDALALPGEAFLPPVDPGTEIGELSPSLCESTGLNPLRVIAPASHDTASAVLAVPAEGDDWAYLSSGTWSLLGVETKAPITGPQALNANWTNEGGYEGRFRFLKNITGMWIIQEIARSLGNRYSFTDLAAMAKAQPAFVSLIDPDDTRFFRPANMAREIAHYCRETGQAVPETPGALVRCAYDSLSLLYRKTLNDLRTLSGKEIKTLHVVGGGSQADFLNQLTASATGIPVLAGPVEATALGNALAQFLTTGAIASVAEARTLIRRNFPVKLFEPDPGDGIDMDDAYLRFASLPAPGKSA